MPAEAQIFQVGAGTSSQFRAHGGSVALRGPGYDGWFGIGSLDGLKFGAFMRTKVRGYTLGFGDDAIPFRLPSDVFDNSHYFMGRGISVGKNLERVRTFAFLGATSEGFGTPFFRGARARRGVGAFFLDAQLNPRVRLFSRNAFSDRQTSIHGLEWQPYAGVRTAVAGGVGGSAGYFATSLSAEREWIEVKAAYIHAGNQFRRIAVQTPLGSEIDRENVLVTLRPKPFMSFSVGRQNFLQPFNGGRANLRGTVNQYLGTLTLEKWTVSGAFFESHAQGLGNAGTSISIRRDFAGRIQVNGNLLRSWPDQGPAATTWITTVREVISPRLSLLQVVNRSDSHTSVAFGGDFISNRLTIGINYQTLYVPFRAGNKFKQAVVLNISLRLFGTTRLNAGTFVAPDGSVKYTVQGGTFLYRGTPAPGAPAAPITLHNNIVRGQVRDVDGKPVRGAALRVDGDLVFSDSQGRFFVRKRKAGSYRLQVVLDQFLLPGRYEVVSAPPAVAATPDAVAQAVTVVLRRITPETR